MTTILKNKIQCRHCDSIVESRYRHDYVECDCGKVAADGGKDYLRRSFQTTPEDDYIEMSETKEN